MTDNETTAQQVPPRAARPRRGAGLTTGVAMAALMAVLGLALGACQNRAGMPCQQQSDCNTGLLCNRPPLAGPQGFGICEPGLHGLGEICVSSAECNAGLVCSTDVGQPSMDGWHGTCQVGSLTDAAQGGAGDLGAAKDQAGSDGSADL